MKSQLVLDRSLWVALAALGVALAGCSGGDTTAATGAEPAKGPTYYRDAKAIIDAKCAGCHNDGGIAPFALTSYAEVSAHKAEIASAVTRGTMPPWPPEKSCGEYTDDRSLSEEQSAALTGWVSAGALEGHPSEAPTAQKPARGLSRVDLTLEMPVAYTPVTAPDDYRCFMVDWPGDKTTYVTGFGVEPGTAAIVHHVIAYLIPPADVAEYQKLDDAEPGPGYTCFGGSGGTNAGWIGGWAPGALGNDFPAGTGIEVTPGSRVVLQIHYNTSTTAASADRSKVVLKIDPTVEKKAFVMPWANPSWIKEKTMVIPAHTADATASWAFDPSPFMGAISKGVLANSQPYTIYSAGLHMHTRGTSAVTRIER
ncbi:MAG: monooxygenase, partial [Byssovorax sp.]